MDQIFNYYLNNYLNINFFFHFENAYEKQFFTLRDKYFIVAMHSQIKKTNLNII